MAKGIDMTLEDLQKNKKITLKGEIWKFVKDFDKYAVSNYGRVYNLKGEKFPKFRAVKFVGGTREYLSVQLYQGSKTKKPVVHRLVAEVFCKNNDPKNKTVVDHIDNDPKNNMAINLRWVTPIFNTSFAKTDEQQKYTRWLLSKIIKHKNKKKELL